MSEKLTGDNFFSSESGSVGVVVCFRGAGLVFAGGRTVVRALLTKFPTTNLADADVPRKMSPNDTVTSKIIRTVRTGVFNLNMGAAPCG
jgi:hypothetical protein